MTRHCRVCGVRLKPGANWTASAQRNRQYICQTCKVLRDRRYREANREHVLAQGRIRSARWRANAAIAGQFLAQVGKNIANLGNDPAEAGNEGAPHQNALGTARDQGRNILAAP